MRTSRATFAARIAPRWDFVAVGVLTVLAAVIRARGIGTTNLWLDESNSWLLSTYSLRELLDNLSRSPVSPLYFILLRGWAFLFGDSVAAMRSFSLFVSLPLVPLGYILGRQTVGRAAGVVAALLLAISPLQLYFAQEARFYMPATLFATLAAVGYLEWRADAVGRLAGVAGKRHGDRWLWLYGIGAVASFYTLAIAPLVCVGLAVDAALVLVRRSATSPGIRRSVVVPWVNAQIAVGLACMPRFLAYDPGTAKGSQGWRTAMGPIGAAKDFFEFFLASIHGLYFYPWNLVPAIVDKWGRAVVLQLIVVFPLTIIALVTAFAYPPRRATRGPARALYCALLIPLVIGAVVSVWQGLDLARYLFFVTPYLCVLLAAGITRAPRWVGGAVLASLVWASIYGVSQYHTIGARDSDFRPTAALLADSARAGDAIVVQPPEAGVQLSYYLRGRPALAVWGIRAGAMPDSVLLPMPGGRTWVALDYRSRWYNTPPDSLDKALIGTVVRDGEVGSGERRVRVIEVRNASPSPQAHDTAATCCGSRATR